MYSRLLLACALTAAVALPAAAQETRVYRTEPGAMARAFSYGFSGEEDYDRAVIGITTSSGSARDTLGVLIGSITPGGPAEKAGLEEGNRIASINGVNLKLDPRDVGEWDISSMMTRRFTREMARLKAGDEIDLRVYSGGQFKNVKIKTVMYEDLYRTSRSRTTRIDDEDRPVLGVQLGSSGSKRDTLGVLITWINDGGPAAKAGLEEGNRIQAIGTVDLRVNREDAGDAMLASVKVSRLQRELQKLRPGDEVELKIYSDGRVRTVKVKTTSAYDLNRESRRRTGSITIDGLNGLNGLNFGPRALTIPAPAPVIAGGVRRITM
jgi:predicted metalloprotease with PDZ domain